MKRIKQLIVIIIVISISFYYTEKTIDFIRENDPLMIEIKQLNNNYNKKAVNAKIIGNNIIPGIYGAEIDYQKTYQQMKKYGNYNETLTTMKEVAPSISIDNNYDKYIFRGNNNKRQAALVFTVYNEDIDTILSILEKRGVKATFFIDGIYLEKNINKIKNMKTHEIELLSYNNSYNKSFFKTSLSYLESLTKKEGRYCFTKSNNKKLLKMCSKLKMHTIKPTIIINNYCFKEIKNNTKAGSIIYLDINKYIEKEIGISIDYLLSKGYNLVLLDELITEKQ